MKIPTFSKIKQSPYLKLILFFVSFVWFISFSRIVLPIHLLQSGLSFSDLAIGGSLDILGQVLTVFLLSRLHQKNKYIWFVSIFLYILVFSLQVFLPIAPIYFVSTFIAGVASVSFYGTYNVSHFELTPRNKTGFGAATFFNILIGVGILAPVFAGSVASFSVFALFFLSFLFALVPLSLLWFQTDIQISFSLRESLKEISKVKSIIFIRGFHEARGLVIDLITFKILTDFFDLGLYGTVIAILGIIIRHLVGLQSDKMKSKKSIIAPLAILNGFLTFLYMFDIFQVNILWWGMLNLVAGKVDGIFDQTALAFIMDETRDRLKATFGREFVLNLGRLAGTLVVVLGFVIPGFLDYSIMILALSMFVYAVVVWRMKLTCAD